MDTKRKYGLITAISTVVGIVIGSGVFFKSSAILEKTEGNLAYSLLAWLIGGVIMLISAYAIGIVSSRVERNNGVVDYVEESSNRFCGYLVANYLTFIYYPILVSIVCYLSANYVLVLFGLNQSLIWLFVIILFLISFITNIFSPVIAGYFQVSTTIVKVIPIFVIAIISLVWGIILMFNPFQGAVVITKMIGIFVMVYAILEFSEVFFFKRNLKMLRDELEK